MLNFLQLLKHLWIRSCFELSTSLTYFWYTWANNSKFLKFFIKLKIRGLNEGAWCWWGGAKAVLLPLTKYKTTVHIHGSHMTCIQFLSEKYLRFSPGLGHSDPHYGNLLDPVKITEYAPHKEQHKSYVSKVNFEWLLVIRIRIECQRGKTVQMLCSLGSRWIHYNLSLICQ